MKMQQELFPKQVKRIFFIVCAVITLVGIAYQINRSQQGYWDDENIRIEDLTICAGIDETEGRMISPDVISRRLDSDQFICGRIRSRSYASLYFLFYKEDYEHESLAKWFEDEYFASPLYIKAGDPTGIYRVEIFQGRKQLGMLIYAVDDNEIKKIGVED